MKLVYIRKLIRRILLGILLLILFAFTFIFIVIPCVYRYSYSLQRGLLFLNLVNWPNIDFKVPTKLGLLGSRSLYIQTDDNVTLGVWHILPSGLLPSLALHIVGNGVTNVTYDKWLSHGEPIVIYNHGNSGNRGAGHRVELYKILQRNNYHVIAFDYRSYGDSSKVDADETGVVTDSKTVYNWVKERAKNSHIFVWGHSLGTGISSHALDDLEREGSIPSGLILEAPFNNLADEIKEYPMSKVFRHLPWFNFFFTDPMYENGLRFESDKHLRSVSAPILILHAEDDRVVPFQLGVKLYKSILKHRGGNGLVRMVTFEVKHHFGHKLICKAVNLPSIVMKFVNDSIQLKTTPS